MIRKANMGDIKSIHRTLSLYGKENLMIPRPLSQLYDHIRDFTVFEVDKQIVGFGALQFCWEDLAEIRSLAVVKEFHNKGIGSKIIESLISEAIIFGVTDIFTLTYQPKFFKKIGFEVIDRSELPLKIWQDCITCVKFPDCDETAMIYNI